MNVYYIYHSMNTNCKWKKNEVSTKYNQKKKMTHTSRLLKKKHDVSPNKHTTTYPSTLPYTHTIPTGEHELPPRKRRENHIQSDLSFICRNVSLPPPKPTPCLATEVPLITGENFLLCKWMIQFTRRASGCGSADRAVDMTIPARDNFSVTIFLFHCRISAAFLIAIFGVF